MGIAEILTTFVAPFIVALIQSAIKAGESLGLDAATLKAAIATELRSQADVIEQEAGEVDALVDAAQKHDAGG